MTMTASAEPKMTPELIAKHGITKEEYEKIKKILGREPNITELGMFSVMWSEHCSYKNSKPILKILGATAEHTRAKILVKAGEENAGIMDIGDGQGICFKIESHNHPSAVEPFQGAATGVGGIMRDIFTMGARPILSMNSLRFGSLDSGDKNTTKRLFKGVVSGISHYGNCMGVPTIGGEVYFQSCYEGNPLVNAFCLGLIENKDIVKGKASGVGNPVYYVGSATGRDGLGGAAFASRELTEESQADRPAVQVGDPFMEKLLLEACLELIKTDALVGMQDMGAAGLTCSTCETAARGNTGIEIDLAKVPLRETGMIPYEIMLSESQERMLIIAKKGKEKVVEDIFKKWDLHAVQIGEVKEGNLMRVLENGKLVAEIPAKALADDGPIYIREEEVPKYLKEAQSLDLASIKEPQDFNLALEKLLNHPTIASKAWVWQQYDHMVRTDTVFYPGHDAALVRIKHTNKGIAVSTDCNSLYCYLDPFEGGKIAVAEAVRNVVCSGALPLGISNCLNFGNPMKPEVFWQFHNAVSGMAEACKALKTPVTGGNVSFYNESPTAAVYPTPTISAVGLIENIQNRVPSHFTAEGDLIFLIGETKNEIGGTHYLMTSHGLEKGLPPRLDLKKEAALVDFMLEQSGKKLFSSCHDLSEGGLAVAAAECAIGSGIGAIIDHIDLISNYASLRQDAVCFGESQSRILVSAKPENKEAIIKAAQEKGLAITQVGKTGGKEVVIGDRISRTIEQLKKIYDSAIPERMKS